MMTTQARRPTFTTNRQRGNAGSPTLNHTTITRAGPSASLGDDPSSHSSWRSPLLHPPTHLSPHPHTNRLYTRYYKDCTHPIWEKKKALKLFIILYELFGSNFSNHRQVSKVVFTYFGLQHQFLFGLNIYAPYLTAAQVGSFISLRSHFCRDLMQENQTAVSHMTPHSC